MPVNFYSVELEQSIILRFSGLQIDKRLAPLTNLYFKFLQKNDLLNFYWLRSN